MKTDEIRIGYQMYMATKWTSKLGLKSVNQREFQPLLGVKSGGIRYHRQNRNHMLARF